MQPTGRYAAVNFVCHARPVIIWNFTEKHTHTIRGRFYRGYFGTHHLRQFDDGFIQLDDEICSGALCFIISRYAAKILVLLSSPEVFTGGFEITVAKLANGYTFNAQWP
jgi:hypothetical protein